ncbi:hypothetical protein ASPWEDRAFT_743234 [Aspergillus wentii DTO 134E9]|uniref:Uncharacterized protein n=1 Tax=Aspergillus wentii DTO 134E9 TaxID=1073089 RepID=A0A1L9RIB0_ASPWE|nr:uncharacterized protein ASPWEDRAFT_743234 [Aspergillus wentii DTO 134E9]OJJ34598.1 hypothetical protein ASPWEDRAFT_743234 [Aspergillus wentii DTO 134E9]
MIQAFLPLLLKSTRGIIVNHTPIAPVVAPPFTGLYATSKSSLTILTVSLHAELSPFGLKIVAIKSGTTQSYISSNQLNISPTASKSPLYYLARDRLNVIYSGKPFDDGATPTMNGRKRL